jgi:hypothetical protein
MEFFKFIRKILRDQIRPRGQQLPELYKRRTKLLKAHAQSLSDCQVFHIFGKKAIDDKTAELNADGDAVEPVICEHA